jgi:hypothetical protein
MEALSILNLASNNIGEVFGWRHEPKRIFKYYHSDGRQQDNKPSGEMGKREGIIAIANVIPDMRAIVQFTFSGDSDDSTPVTMETSMVEANFGGKGLGISGAIMVAAFLPKCT